MAPYIYWFLLALGLVMVELATGTFYMLVLALALSIGGFAAFFGYSAAIQYTVSAVAGIIGTLILQRVRRGKAAHEPNQSLDIGQPIQSISWNQDGSARAVYRGAEWSAEPENKDTPRAGPLYIKEMRGSTLIITHHKPKA